MKHRTIALAISVALGATLASAVRAQAVQAGDAAGPTLLDEVTVTARKREEALQDIPLVVNAFAGAINYIPKKPSTEWRADATVAVGSDQREDYGAFISGPLSPDRAMFKLAWSGTESDGTIPNRHPLAAQGMSPGNRGNLGGYDNSKWSAGLTPYNDLNRLPRLVAGVQRNTAWCGELP